MAKQAVPPRSSLLRFEACALTHQGKVRPKHEDAFVLGSLVQPAQITAAVFTDKIMEADGSIAAVIDGMGGMGGGDVDATWLAQRWAKRRVSSRITLKRQLCHDHEELMMKPEAHRRHTWGPSPPELPYFPSTRCFFTSAIAALTRLRATLVPETSHRSLDVSGKRRVSLTSDSPNGSSQAAHARSGGVRHAGPGLNLYQENHLDRK